MYLDTEERRRFAQIAHEYLIDQLEYTGSESIVMQNNPKVKLSFNHPIKELIWVLQRSDFTDPTSVGQSIFKGMQPLNFSTDWDRSNENALQIKLDDLVDPLSNVAKKSVVEEPHLHDTSINSTKSLKSNLLEDCPSYTQFLL